MLPEPFELIDTVIAFVEKNQEIVGLIALAAVALGIQLAMWRSGRRASRRRSSRSPWNKDPDLRLVQPTAKRDSSRFVDISDPKEQMEAVSRANFEKQRLMNASEFKVFQLLEDVVRDANTGHRVMSQTSLGEVIRPKVRGNDKKLWKLAQSSINSKRLDFAIFDRFGMLAVAVEYQGSGHYHDSTFMRDAVKREALRKAGVEFIEVPAKYDAAEIRAQITRLISGPSGSP